MSNFLRNSSEYGGIQRQIGSLIGVLGVTTTSTRSLTEYEDRVSQIKHEEIDLRDQKMTSYLYDINVDIKEPIVGLATIGVWVSSPKIYSTSSDATNALSIFGDARHTGEDRAHSVIVSAAATGSSTGLTTTGSVSIASVEYTDVVVGSAISQYYYSGGDIIINATGTVGVNTGNLLIIRDVTGSFITTATVSISGAGGTHTEFTFPSVTGFVGVTSIRNDVIRVKVYDSYEPSYNTSVFPKGSTSEVGLTSSNIGIGYSQFYWENAYNSDDELYYNDALLGPTMSEGPSFPRVESPEMSKVVYSTNNTSNNNQITSLLTGITTPRVGIPTYLAASATIKEYKTEIQDIVWAYKKGQSMSLSGKSKYQSYYDAMDQADPEMDANVPPAPPEDPPRPLDDDEINV